MTDRTRGASGRRWRRVPAVTWLPRYDRGWLRGDVVAGAVVAALAVPQALGYASIAGAPVQVGLYAVPVALVAYAIFGSSRQLVVGPVSTVSVLSGSLLASFGVAGTAQAASYTAALALGSGLVLLTAGLLGIGWVAEFLSKPIVTGFVVGLTILIILGEIPHLLGVPTPPGQVVERVGALGESLTRGDANLATVIVSAVSLLVLFGGQRLAPRLPWGLVVLVGGLTASAALDLKARGVEVVGPVPRGLPTPGLPSVEAGDLAALLAGGAALALVGLAEGLSAARLFAGRGGYRIESDQELFATGAANVASGLFGGIGVAGSLSKTAAVCEARGRTQMAGLVAAGLALVVIVSIASVLSVLPRALLSAIVVNAVWKLMDFAALRRYARVRRNDIVAAVVAAVGVLAFGPLYGLLLAVAGSLLGLVYRSTRVDVEVMGKVPHEKAGWGSTRDHEERATFPGVLVLRVDTPIFWVTAAPIPRRNPHQGRLRARHEGARARHGGDQPDGHDERRRARRPVGLAPQTRHRPVPGPRHVAGPQGAATVRADGRTRRGPPVAQHLPRRAGSPARPRAQARSGDRRHRRRRGRSRRGAPQRGGGRAHSRPQSRSRPPGPAPARAHLTRSSC